MNGLEPLMTERTGEKTLMTLSRFSSPHAPLWIDQGSRSPNAVQLRSVYLLLGQRVCEHVQMTKVDLVLAAC